MCNHNEDDIDCGDCCYNMGWSDAEENESRKPEYKNWDQVNSYYDGYDDYISTTFTINHNIATTVFSAKAEGTVGMSRDNLYMITPTTNVDCPIDMYRGLFDKVLSKMKFAGFEVY